MSNPQWREVHQSRSDGSEPGAGPRYRDPAASGTGWQAPRGFDPRWHDPGRSGGDPAPRGPAGNARDPQPRSPGDRDPRTGATTRRTPGTDQRPSRGREDLRRHGGANRSSGPREPGGLGRWGSLPGWLGVCIIIASAAIGAVATAATRTAPGQVLGVCVVVGTVVAALVVRPSAGRLIFPVPVLFYLIAALASGIAYDRSADSSKTALAIGAAQWIAAGFFAMVLATALAVVLITVRWFIGRRRRRDAAASGRPRGDTGEISGRGGRPDPRGWDDSGQRPQAPLGYQGPGQRPGWRPDPRMGPPPGSGPYNFSSGA
jgi:hypothetical protein